MILAYDVETANGNSIGSICAIGWILISGNQEIDRGYSLINPHCKFGNHNVSVHGITEDAVKDAPDFSQYWHQCLGSKMQQAVVMAYGAGFDMAATEQALFEAGIEDPGIDYVDALRIAQAYYQSPSYKLCDLAEQIGFSYQPHNALADVEALVKVMDHIRIQNHFSDIGSLVKEFAKNPNNTKKNSYVPSMDNKKEFSFRSERCHEIVDRLDELLEGLRICITGDIDGYTRAEVEKEILLHGGKMTSSVTTKTDYLVVGTYADYGAGYISGKQQKALELISAGAAIQIISSSDFVKMLRREMEPIKKELTSPLFVEEAKTRIKEGKKRGKPVIQYLDNGEIVKEYDSVDDAVVETGIHPKTINDTAQGKQKHAGKYCWKYKIEND